jgi:hypothetical protein
VKKNTLPFIVVCLIALSASSFGQERTVEYDTLANHEQYAYNDLSTVSLFETIRDRKKLDDYFLKINYDTLKLSRMPKFDSVIVIAFVAAKMSTGGKFYYHTIKRITEETDSIIVDFHYDSLFLYVKGQPIYTILMLTIPKSDKPVAFRTDIVSSVQKTIGRNVAKINSKQLSVNTRRFYDIKGRMLQRNQFYNNRVIILPTPYHYKKTLFLQKRVTQVE